MLFLSVDATEDCMQRQEYTNARHYWFDKLNSQAANGVVWVRVNKACVHNIEPNQVVPIFT